MQKIKTDRFQLPDIKLAKNRSEKLDAIRACEDAFEQSSNLNHKAAIEKICDYGDVLVAYCEHIVGYCAFYANDTETKQAYISLIAVKPEYQNNCIGKRLLSSCFELARERGMLSIKLEVKNNNYPAFSFYENNGFQRTGVQTEYSSYMAKELEIITNENT